MKRYHAGDVARKAIACMLTGSLVASSLGTPAIAFAKSAEETRIEEMQREYDAAVARLNEYEAIYAQAQADLSKTNYDLAVTEENIRRLQDEIAQTQAKLVPARQNLKTVVADSYKQGGDLSLLELVLSSNSVDELVSRVYYANKSAEARRVALNTVTDLQEDLENGRLALETQKSQQEELRDAQTQQVEVVRDSMDTQKEYANSLSDEMHAAMAAQAEKEAELSLAAAREVLGDERMDQIEAAGTAQAVAQPQPAQKAKTQPAQKDDDDNDAKRQAAQQPTDEQPEQVEGEQNLAPAPAPAPETDDPQVDFEQEPQPEPTPQPDRGAQSVQQQPALDPEPEGQDGEQGYEEPQSQESQGYVDDNYGDDEENAYNGTQYADDESDDGTKTNSNSSGYSASAASTAVAAALQQVGVAYGHDNDGSNWDCNGLTNYAWAQAGVDIPLPSGTYSEGQFQWLKSSGNWVTSASELKEGDLVFFSHDGGETCFHVAMYIGGGQIVHAVGYGSGVQVTDLSYVSGFCGGGSPA